MNHGRAVNIKNRCVQDKNQIGSSDHQFVPSQNKGLLPDSGLHMHEKGRKNTFLSQTMQNLSRSQSGSLKLKDYLHLNGLNRKKQQRESKDRRQEGSKDRRQEVSTNRSQVPNDKKSRQGKDRLYKFEEERQAYEDMVRGEIIEKIEEGVARLGQLKDYFEKDYAKKESNQTFVFLFRVYNHLLEMEKTTGKVGSHIIEFGAEVEGVSPLREGCFWQDRNFQKVGQQKDLGDIMKSALAAVSLEALIQESGH